MTLLHHVTTGSQNNGKMSFSIVINILELPMKNPFAKEYSSLKKMDIRALKATKWALDLTKRNMAGKRLADFKWNFPKFG